MNSTTTTTTLAWKSFRYFGRSHLALALGIAVSTAVIVGALVVGDSVRGSLRGLVMMRLANIEGLMRSRNFFDHELVANALADNTDKSLKHAPLIILTDSSAECQQNGQTRRASHVQVLGIDENFLNGLDSKNREILKQIPAADEIIINESLARELSVQVGDQITLLLSPSGGVPPDSPLGRRELTTKNLPRQKIVSIISDQSIGAVGFQTSQEVPHNVFVSLSSVQDFLQVDKRVNASVVLRDSPSNIASLEAAQRVQSLNQRLQPKLEDFGLQLARHRRVFPDEALGEKADSEPITIYDYYQISSKDLLIDKATDAAILKALGSDRCTRLLSFLANSIQKGAPRPRVEEVAPNGVPAPITRSLGQVGSVRTRTPTMPAQGRLLPYSIVVGVSPNSDLKLSGLDMSGDSLRGSVCIVNSWLAKELDLQPESNSRLILEIFEPETTDGKPVKVYANVRVVGIVELTEPATPYRRRKAATYEQAPTIFNDPDLTPTVEGITDQESISSWDVPFELEHRDLILKQDDQYYENHRLTPKMFLPLATAQQLYGNRFGEITSFRIPADKIADEAELRKLVEPALTSIADTYGLVFVPIRQQMLAASSGTTPFDMLFLSLSSFVIIAGLMLVSLLFKLGIQQRSSQLGLLLSQGFSPTKVRLLYLREFFFVAAVGSLLGIPLGLAYAKLMIAGLESWWIGAISTSFLNFSFSFTSLFVGLFAGVATSLATILMSLRKITKAPALSLLRGVDMDSRSRRNSYRLSGWAAPAIAAIGSLGLAMFASGQSGMGQAGCFFGSGILLLASLWFAVRQTLMLQRRGSNQRSNLLALAIRAIQRNPLRSSLSIGLLAVASFLIASLGVFRMSPTREGYGGFDLIGVSSQPVYDNLGSPAARKELMGVEAEKLRGTVIVPVRMREGDDASCTNLFQTSNPTILGVSESLQGLAESTPGYDFSWAAALKPNAPWDALQDYSNGSKDHPIPVILDQNTAMWSLKQGTSLKSTIVLTLEGRETYFKVVGLLNNSVLQGKLIIAERSFQLLFPKISGYRFFLISTAASSGSNSETIGVLESGLSAAGLDVQYSEVLLEKLLGVQNTYISAFQSLGALGLLLGTIGLIAVQLRSVWERRRELALMQAVGFSKLRIGNLLTIETALLLGIGLLLGIVAAAVSLVPFVLEVGPQLSVVQPIFMLLAVFACGFLSAVLAIRLALKLPLLASLRSE